MRILAICGSQRPQSSNQAFMALAKNYLDQCEWTQFDIFKLPFFDPYLQYSSETPEIVTELRTLAAQTDTILLATPEYAHSAPGVLKNALEWMFHEGTQKKKVFLIIASGQGEHTKAQLIETLGTMDFLINHSQVLLIQGPRIKLSERGEILDHETKLAFENFLKNMVHAY